MACGQVPRQDSLECLGQVCPFSDNNDDASRRVQRVWRHFNSLRHLLLDKRAGRTQLLDRTTKSTLPHGIEPMNASKRDCARFNYTWLEMVSKIMALKKWAEEPMWAYVQRRHRAAKAKDFVAQCGFEPIVFAAEKKKWKFACRMMNRQPLVGDPELCIPRIMRWNSIAVLRRTNIAAKHCIPVEAGPSDGESHFTDFVMWSRPDRYGGCGQNMIQGDGTSSLNDWQ